MARSFCMSCAKLPDTFTGQLISPSTAHVLVMVLESCLTRPSPSEEWAITKKIDLNAK